MQQNTILVAHAMSLYGSQAALARAAGVSQPVIHEALKTGRVGPRLAMGIERATSGAISKSLLRPDLWPMTAPARVAS